MKNRLLAFPGFHSCILLLLFVFFISPNAHAQNRATDSVALRQIYLSTNGSGWNDKTGWEIIDAVGSPLPIDQWFGVILTSGRVTTLDLNSNNLNGTIPDAIGDLTALETLRLPINDLSGSVPTTIGSLIQLNDLNLLGNSLTGTIPSEINSLTNLTSLELQSNQFSGPVPNFSNLTGLTNLAISGNQLIGTIPEYLGSLQNLNLLFLSGNELTGIVPDTLGTLTNLTFLRLDNNQLIDSIPDNFVNLTNINNLLIQNNSFTYLPDLSVLGSFSTFNVSDNLFTFEDLEPNAAVITSNTGQQNFGNPQVLAFTAGDPIFLDAQLPNAGANDTYQWQKDGIDIPGETSLNFSKTSELSDAGVYRLKVTNTLVTAVEIFSEDITVSVAPTPTNEIDSIALVALYDSTNGSGWTNKTGWEIIDGVGSPLTVDQWFGVTVTDGRVTAINLTSNGLQGSIPPEVGSLDSLKTLSISSFSGLGGLIPAEIGQLTALTSLSLEGDFTGSLPTEIGDLSNLQTFNFYSDVLTGGYPASLGNLTALTSLDFFGNSLTGAIPPEFSTLTNLTRLRITVPEGSIPSYIGDLTSLQMLYLTGASDPILFNGTIPTSLGNLTNLTSLTIVNSGITGTIPLELGSLNLLSSLSLSSNQLSGSIPDTLSTMPSLTTLYLSNNIGLSGEVPISFITSSLTELDISNTGLCEPQEASYQNWTSTLSFYQSSGIACFIPTNETDSLALVSIYEATGGPSWTNSFNWLSGTVETWSGVTVTNGRVTTLFLGSNNLVGDLPAELGDLTALESLYLDFNGITSIPTTFTNLSDSLTDGSLEGNQISSIPNLSTATWTNLTSFMFGENSLSFEAIGTSSSVTGFDFDPQFFNIPQQIYDVDEGVGVTLDPQYAGTGDQFQWYKDGVAITDAIGPTLDIPAVGVDEQGAYQLEVQLASQPGIRVLSPDIFVSLLSCPSYTSNINTDIIWRGETQNASFGLTGINEIITIDKISENQYQISDYSANYYVEVTANFGIGVGAPVPAAITDNCGQFSGVPSQSGSLGFDDIISVSYDETIPQLTIDWFNPTNSISETTIFTESAATIPPVNQNDSLALVAFYEATGGTSWNNNGGWLSRPVATWHGVTIDSGRVTRLELEDDGSGNFQGNNLNGAIPAEIGQLDSLKFLNISQANFSGDLPVEIASLNKLEYLWIRASNLSGTLPDELGSMTNLLSIRMGQNNFTGSLPSSIGNLTLLQDLGLDNNELSNSIPAEIGSLSSLIELNLFDNNLSGSIPIEIQNMSSLQALRLQNNQLSGEIPLEVGDMPSISNIRLDGNILTGSIPASIGNLANLQYFYGYDNDLSGPLPPEMGSLSQLLWLRLENNALTGSIPAEFDSLANLQILNLSNNELSGAIPDLTSLNQLMEVYLHDNQFSGQLPAFFGNNLSLTQFDIARNNFTGSIPATFSQLTVSERLNIRENSLADLPNLSNLTQLFSFDVSLNRFGSADINPNRDVITRNDGQVGPILAADSLILIELANALGGADWPQGQSWIDQDTAAFAWAGVSVLDERVVSLSLDQQVIGLYQPGINTELFANVPPILSGLDSLNSLSVAATGLTAIPDNISQLTNLRSLFVSNNDLTTLPASLTTLPDIEQIGASNNRLTSLPDLNGLPQPINLNVTNNNLSFEDLVPNATIDDITFSPQRSLSGDEVIGLTPGESLTLTVDVTAFDANDALIWRKDGAELGATGASYTVDAFTATDAGVYTLEFTNPALPDLILTSGRFTLVEKAEGAFTWIYDDNFVREGQNGSTYGAFVADYNNDGFDDIYTMNLDTVSSYLYQNNGDGTFTQTSGLIPSEAAYGHAWADVNNDGFLDLLASDVVFTSTQGTRDGVASLYTNVGGESFVSSPLDGAYLSTAFGDINNDGWIDAIAVANGTNHPELFLNDSTGNLVKQANPINIDENFSISNPFLVDVNGDGFLDMYRTGTVRSLYINDGNLGFIKEETDPIVTTEISSAWGASWGDLDNDGDMDAFVRAYLPGTDSYFFFNDGQGNFTGQTCEELFGESCERGRASVLADVNNDGYMDIIFNERVSTNDTIKIYLNNANTGYSLIENQNFIGTQILRGLSVLDYDNDGFLDIYSPSTINTDPNMLYQNNGNANNWLKVNLEGTTSNRAGVGAEVSVYAGNLLRYQQVITSSGLHSGNTYNLHYGLGTNTVADSVVVNWPSGQKSIIENVTANQRLEILERGAPIVAFDSLSLKTQEFQPVLFGSVTDTAATVEVVLQGVTYPAINNMDSTWTLAAGIVDSLFNGSYEVIARATNDIGVGVDTATLVIDQSPPFVSVQALVSTSRSPELTGFVNDTSATVTVVIEENDYLTILNKADSTWSLAEGSIQPPLEDGTYDIVVLGENRFGVASDTTSNELKLDASAPEVFVDNLGTSIVSPELTGFLGDLSATLLVTVGDRGDFTPTINSADSTWSIAAGTFDPGFTEGDSPITITAVAEDSLGNSSTAQGELVITNTIQALQPSRVTSNSFRANWSAVVDVQEYTLEVSDTEDFSSILEEITTDTETSYRVENLDFESTYYYRATFDNGVDAPTTSNVVTVNTTIKQSTQDDFNSLALIESATGGGNWTVPSNWTNDTRKQDWEFIVLENERIVEVNIPDNNLTGRFPFTPLMTALRKVDVSGNALVDVDALTRLRAINEVDLSNNFYEFDDLEKLRSLSTFSYSPQKTIISFNERSNADSLLVRVFTDTSLSISAKGEFLNYTWFLDDAEIATSADFATNDSILQILSIDYGNMGKFKAAVSSDSLPDLSIPVDSMFVFAVADFSVDVNGGNGELISDNVDGYLLLTEQRGAGFDTLSTALNQPSAFTFRNVILGDYLISIDSDPAKYVPTYYSNAFQWEEADTVMFRKDTAFQVSMTLVPGQTQGDGSLDVLIEEDFGDDPSGRIDARRRAAKRKCGLRRKRSGGRIGQDDDEFELIAYGETDDNGEFRFGQLPQGTYRFFVEYPGIPLDESSFVEFEVGEAGISDTDFKLEAFASPDGIAVTIEKILGVIFEYFKDLQVYPNPTTDLLKIQYRHLADRNVGAKLMDLSGNTLWSTDIRSGYNGYEEIDVSGFEAGIYFLHVYDKENSKKNVATYRVMIRD